MKLCILFYKEETNLSSFGLEEAYYKKHYFVAEDEDKYAKRFRDKTGFRLREAFPQVVCEISKIKEPTLLEIMIKTLNSR